MFDLKLEHPLLTLTRLSSTLALPRILREAASIGLGGFVCESPRTLAEIASHFGFNEAVLKHVMDVMVSQDLFIERDGLYHACELTEEIDTLDQLFVGMESWNCWSALDVSLRSGTPAFEQIYGTDFFSYLSEHPDKNDNWNRWNSVTAQEGFDGVVTNLPLEEGESVCDIGGGEGDLLHYILEEFPDCSATLLERPDIEIAADAPFDYVPGDMFTDIPSGHDVYILSRVMCNWDDDRSSLVLRNIAQAMGPTSRLFVIDGVMPEKDDPERGSYAANSLGLFLMFGARIRELGEFVSLFDSAGLQLVSNEKLDTQTHIAWSLLIAKTV